MSGACSNVLLIKPEKLWLTVTFSFVIPEVKFAPTFNQLFIFASTFNLTVYLLRPEPIIVPCWSKKPPDR